MKSFRVNSHMVEAVGYDDQDRILQVVFKGGKIYNYEDVSIEVFEALMDSESIGNFILEYIMNDYHNYEVE